MERPRAVARPFRMAGADELSSRLLSNDIQLVLIWLPMVLSRTSRNQKGDAAPRLCGQLWMIRRFTSARLFPQSAGAKQKNHSGSGHYGECRVALRHFNRNGFFGRKRQESGDKGLIPPPRAMCGAQGPQGKPEADNLRNR